MFSLVRLFFGLIVNANYIVFAIAKRNNIIFDKNFWLSFGCIKQPCDLGEIIAKHIEKSVHLVVVISNHCYANQTLALKLVVL
jgi:hypothetical protein